MGSNKTLERRLAGLIPSHHSQNVSSRPNSPEPDDIELLRRKVNTGAAQTLTPTEILSLQRTIGNQAVGRVLRRIRQAKPMTSRTYTGSQSSMGTVQRAISIGMQHLPRTLELAMFNGHLNQNQFEEVVKLNSERDTIYIFENNEHFLGYFTGKGGFPPQVHKLSVADLQSGHEFANMMRFNSIYQPSNVQVPSHAPGMHQIPQQQLPPSGEGHHWSQVMNGPQQEYAMWSNKLQPPTNTTQFHTYGNPNNPSVWTTQGNYNMGGRVMPAPSQYLVNITRSQTSYGGLPSETGYVRGHPMSLKQQQISTNPLTPHVNFDNSGHIYTRESDGTMGGNSTFRYNQLERPAQSTMLPFNQVNVSSNPTGYTKMGPSPVETIFSSALQPNGSYNQMEFDNTVDYRDQIGSGNSFHSRLAQHIKSNNFPYEEVYKPGEDFEDPNRNSYPGYMSPPPTPFLVPELRDEDPNVVLDGKRYQGQSEIYNGDLWTIVEARYNAGTNKTHCKLEKVSTSTHGGFF